jgi:hypothetical protein
MVLHSKDRPWDLPLKMLSIQKRSSLFIRRVGDKDIKFYKIAGRSVVSTVQRYSFFILLYHGYQKSPK